MTIPEYVEMVVSGNESELFTPFDVASKLHAQADTVFQLLKSMNIVYNQELKATLQDIKTMAHLGKYYAHKIAGSTYVALYRQTKDKVIQNKAVEELTLALASWQEFTMTALEQNSNPLWTNRVGYVDWVKTTEYVKLDIEMAMEN
jgi:hypothetical protein